MAVCDSKMIYWHDLSSYVFRSLAEECIPESRLVRKRLSKYEFFNDQHSQIHYDLLDLIENEYNET